MGSSPFRPSVTDGEETDGPGAQGSGANGSEANGSGANGSGRAARTPPGTRPRYLRPDRALRGHQQVFNIGMDMREEAIVEAAAGVHLVHGSNTNWVVLSEGDSVTLIDTGYPGDRQELLASLKALGHAPEAVSAVLITHAHNDHLGSAEFLNSTYGTPVQLHEAEVPHARREFLHQVSVGQVMRQAWRPGVLPWAVHAIRSGGTADVRMTKPEAFPHAGPLDLPGRPVPVHTPGHTPGHCVYHLPDAGVLISGDALVSGHPTSRIRGPQLLPEMFDTERAGALASLERIEALAADVLLPGHGPVHRAPVREAAQRARELAG